MRKLFVVLIGFAMMFTVVGSAIAASSSTSLYVYGYVGGTCSVSADSLYFSTTSGSSSYGYSYIYALCPLGQPYKISLNGGQYNNYIYSGYRHAADGYGHYNPYIIYKPDLYSLWGDSDFANTYPSGSSYSYTGTGGTDSHYYVGTFYATSGYSGYFYDIVTVTVNY